jgi:hypothetical protein
MVRVGIGYISPTARPNSFFDNSPFDKLRVRRNKGTGSARKPPHPELVEG